VNHTSQEAGRPLVSVIVPTKNSAKTIGDCLESIKHQTYPRCEIIVVDNYSTDETRKIAGEYTSTVLVSGPERSSQVRLGFNHSRGDFIYKVDADFVLDRNVIEKAVEAATHEDAVAVVIPNLSDPTISFWARVRYYERLTYLGSNLIEAARFYRRDTYQKAGGHSTDLVAYEEHDVHNRVSQYGRVTRISGAAEWHIGEPRKLSDVVRTHWYYGKSVYAYVKRNPSRAPLQIIPVRKSFFTEQRLLLRVPGVFLGLLFYQMVRYLSALFGLLTTLSWEDVDRARTRSH